MAELATPVYDFMDSKLRAMIHDAIEDASKQHFGSGIMGYVKHQAVMAAVEHLIGTASVDWSTIIDAQGKMMEGAGERFAADIQSTFTRTIQDLSKAIENFTTDGNKDARLVYTLNAIAQYKGGATIAGIQALASGEIAKLADTAGQSSVSDSGKKRIGQIGSGPVDI